MSRKPTGASGAARGALRLVAICNNAIEAQMTKDVLSTHGVEAHVHDAYTASVYGGAFSSMLGGVKVLVPEGQLAQAKEILRALGADVADGAVASGELTLSDEEGGDLALSDEDDAPE